jgi:hypothetical protein
MQIHKLIGTQMSLMCGGSPRVIACGLLTTTLVAAAGYGLLGWSVYSEPVSDAPLAAATGFLKDVAAGRFEAAYARTTAEFRSRHSLHSFRAMLEQSPCLRQAEYGGANAGDTGAMKLRVRDSTSGDCLIEAAYDHAEVFLKLTVDLDQWKISACIVQANIRKAGRQGACPE